MLPSGFQIDGISRTDGSGFLLWDEGSSTRFLLVELAPGAHTAAGTRGQRVRLQVADALPEAPDAELAGASFRDQRLELLPAASDPDLRDWAENRLRTEVTPVPGQRDLVSTVRDGPVWRGVEIDETGRLRLGTLRGDSLAGRSRLDRDVDSADTLGRLAYVQAMTRRAPGRIMISFSRRPVRRYVVRTDDGRVEAWSALPAAVDSARRDPATGSSPMPAHWRALALVPLDRGGARKTFLHDPTRLFADLSFQPCENSPSSRARRYPGQVEGVHLSLPPGARCVWGPHRIGPDDTRVLEIDQAEEGMSPSRCLSIESALSIQKRKPRRKPYRIPVNGFLIQNTCSNYVCETRDGAQYPYVARSMTYRRSHCPLWYNSEHDYRQEQPALEVGHSKVSVLPS